LVEKVNGTAYTNMLKVVRDIIPKSATVMEVASGTGAISLAIFTQL
jgi:hypothetical protein